MPKYWRDSLVTGLTMLQSTARFVAWVAPDHTQADKWAKVADQALSQALETIRSIPEA